MLRPVSDPHWHRPQVRLQLTPQGDPAMPALPSWPYIPSALWALSVLLALLLAYGLSSVPAARAVPSLTFTPSFSAGSDLGEAGTTQAELTFTGSEYHGSPEPVTEVVIHLPAGVGGTDEGFPICSEGEAYEEAYKRAGSCPVDSIAGPVGSIGLEIEEGGALPGEPTKRVPVTGAIQPVFAEPEEDGTAMLYFIAQARGFEFPVRAWYRADAPPYGRELHLEVPLIEDIPGQPYASITSLNLTLGTTRETVGQLVSSLMLPPECPANGQFPWAVDLTYTTNGKFENQTHGHATAETTCPPTSSKQVTTTTLQVSPAAPHSGEVVTYSAIVTPHTLGATLPTGSVTFVADGTAISGCSAQALVSGVASSTASCQVSYSTSGTHQLTARYGGDSDYLSSEATTQTVTVSEAPPPQAGNSPAPAPVISPP